MRPTKTIKLSRTYAIHGQAVTEIGLKEPTWDDFAELGELAEVQAGPDGLRVVIENRQAVKAYVERCVDGIEPANLGLLGLADARKLRDALYAFFRLEPAPSQPPNASSSTSAGDRPTSEASASPS